MKRSKYPIRVAALNYRMGGQLSCLIALTNRLREKGEDAEILLPEGLSDLDKESLVEFSRQSFVRRMFAIATMIYRQGKKADEIFHLMLPSPGFAWIAWLMGMKRERTLLQWEGRPIDLNAESFRQLLANVSFMLPRMVLNNAWLHVIARVCGYQQLVTTNHYRDWLEIRGHKKVSCIANCAEMAHTDFACTNQRLSAFIAGAPVLISYIGHAHPVKGVSDLIDAFSTAYSRNPSLKLLLALSMDGSTKAIAKQIERFPEPLKERVFLTSTVPVGYVLKHTSLLALPYRSLISTTLLPSLLLEADLAGCPVVVTDLPDFAGIIPRNSPGWHLVPPGDRSALAALLASIAERGNSSPLNLPSAAERTEALIKLYVTLSCRDASYG